MPQILTGGKNCYNKNTANVSWLTKYDVL